MTKKIITFLDENKPETPCVVIDLDIIKKNYQKLKWYLPEANIFYAVKANPGKPVVQTLAEEGSNFDIASIGELDLVLSLGVDPSKISYGNTIKKEKDIAYAYQKGVRLFAVDSENELMKVARSAPGSNIFCRLLWESSGADWPLSRKFGCDYEMVADILIKAKEVGVVPYGVSFHVGSQQKSIQEWDLAISKVAEVFRAVYREAEIELKMINLGGGLPGHLYNSVVPDFESYIKTIRDSLNENFNDDWPIIIMEPGRSVSADAGIIQTEIVLISQKYVDNEFQARWIFLDCGKFNGLIESMDEAIKYKFLTKKDSHEMGPVIIAGPTCDSCDIIAERYGIQLPIDLEIGDKILIPGTGSYSSSYCSINFNGFPPLKEYFI